MDVDFDRGLLRIDSNYVVRSGQRRLKGTKTDDERRLSLDVVTVQLLQTLLEARRLALAPVALALPAEAFVFSPDPLGERPWHPDHFTHDYRALADEVGVAEPLKNLRHFNATQLLAAGVDLRTTAARLGHSDGGATTLRVYASSTRPADQRAAELLATDLTALRRRAAAAAPAAAVRVPRGVARTRRPASEVLLEPGPIRTYVELAEQLRVAIGSGRLAPGDLLPTVPDLAGHCGLARSTVSRALGLLAEEAVIARTGTRWATALCGSDVDGRGRGGDCVMVAESSWTPPGMDPLLPSPVQELHDESLAARQVRVFLKRDDLIHPELPGNKWRKLKYNLAAAADERPAHAPDVRRRVLQPHPRGRRRGPPPRLRDDRRDPR